MRIIKELDSDFFNFIRLNVNFGKKSINLDGIDLQNLSKFNNYYRSYLKNPSITIKDFAPLMREVIIDEDINLYNFELSLADKFVYKLKNLEFTGAN